MSGSGRLPLAVVTGALAVACLALAHRAEIKARAETALGAGMPAREAQLARGFVLGEDEGIPQQTVEDFRRAGLSHLLAVSGQNVALLSLLAMPFLAALGMPLRARLVWILAAIAVYVPLAGAGPSVVRAGVMGALGVLATLVGRPSSRLYALAVAAVVTLGIDPRLGADVGWQLSFAAVLGIALLGPSLRRTMTDVLGAGGWRGALVDGTAMTVAATLATAPLIAFHFEAVSTVTLLANLLALPAVAPAMWLGMLGAGLGQVPGAPVGLVNALAAPLLAYIAQVAAWCGSPTWAYLHVRLGALGLLGAYAVLAAAAIGIPALLRRRRLAMLRRCNVFPAHRQGKTLHLSWRAGFAVATLAALLLVWAETDHGSGEPPSAGLRIEVLDVGQGDAILLQPARAPAILVDGGPTGDGLVEKLRAAGVKRLGLAILTHEQSDHSGGIEELFGSFPVARFAYARVGRDLLAEARAAGAVPLRLSEGESVRAGRLRLEVLWPPSELLASPLGVTDPNNQAVVLLARWRDFSMLLSADAEAESVPIQIDAVDVLKVAHHGSDDAGLDTMLDSTRPRLAVISVGAGNSYGHPSPATLANLAAHRVPTLRTDLDGTIEFYVGQGGFFVRTGR